MSNPMAPALVAELHWQDELRFEAHSGNARMTLDSGGAAGPSPVQALAFGLAGCMGIDLVHILKKGRHPLTGLAVRLEAGRSTTDPKRITWVRLHFVVSGAVPKEAVERALELSRSTYCSVWHSLRQDLEFETSFELTAGPE